MLDRKNLHKYQEKIGSHIISNKFCGAFIDMGLGKTVSALTAIEFLTYQDFAVDKVLVIAPKRVVESVWKQEADKWKHLNRLRITRIIGNEKQRTAALKEKADVYIISRDNIAWLCGLYGGLMLPFDMLVIDESSSFKNSNSLRFKTLRKVRGSFNRIVILTGTPAPNGLLDLWSQIYLLDAGQRLGKFITYYRNEFFKPGKSKGHIVYKYDIQKDGEERIYKLIEDICISMKLEDYLTLPERIDNFIELELPAKIAKQYRDFEQEQVLELFEKDEISVANAAALSNKLLQFANGAVYDEERNVHPVHTVKLDALEELIEEASGNPVLIFYTFKHDLTRIQERLKSYKLRVLKTNKDVEDWNAGKIQVLAMHPASGGHGLNLQAGGNIIVWFGLTWSLELYLQANARLNRQGQLKPVIIHHLIAAGTMDETVMKAIKLKDDKQKSLMEAIKATLKKYKKNFSLI